MTNAILVVAEQLRGQLSDITFEMLGVGKSLATTLQVPLQAVVLGAAAAPLAGQLGLADKVLVADNPVLDMAPADTVAAALAQLLQPQSTNLILLGGTNVSMGIGALLAARTALPFVNFCRQIQVRDGTILVTSQILGGKMLADVRLPEAKGIVSICPGAFSMDAGKSGAAPTLERVNLNVEPHQVTFTKFLEPDTGDVDITRQNVLVAVGRGVQNQDNIALAEDLAQALGGVVCASRPVIDQGWLPLSRQVGKSGMTVKPRVYLALGISGAPEHWEGMQGAQTIIAVNTDAKAPIFDGAHYGVCGDALEIIPLLTDKLKARKG